MKELDTARNDVTEDACEQETISMLDTFVFHAQIETYKDHIDAKTSHPCVCSRMRYDVTTAIRQDVKIRKKVNVLFALLHTFHCDCRMYSDIKMIAVVRPLSE